MSEAPLPPAPAPAAAPALGAPVIPAVLSEEEKQREFFNNLEQIIEDQKKQEDLSRYLDISASLPSHGTSPFLNLVAQTTFSKLRTVHVLLVLLSQKTLWNLSQFMVSSKF